MHHGLSPSGVKPAHPDLASAARRRNRRPSVYCRFRSGSAAGSFSNGGSQCQAHAHSRLCAFRRWEPSAVAQTDRLARTPCDRTVCSQTAWPIRQPAGLARPSAGWKPGDFQLHSARARLLLIPDVAHRLDTTRRKRKTGGSTEHERPARSPYRMMALPPPWGRFQ